MKCDIGRLESVLFAQVPRITVWIGGMDGGPLQIPVCTEEAKRLAEHVGEEGTIRFELAPRQKPEPLQESEFDYEAEFKKLNRMVVECHGKLDDAGLVERQLTVNATRLLEESRKKVEDCQKQHDVDSRAIGESAAIGAFDAKLLRELRKKVTELESYIATRTETGSSDTQVRAQIEGIEMGPEFTDIKAINAILSSNAAWANCGPEGSNPEPESSDAEKSESASPVEERKCASCGQRESVHKSGGDVQVRHIFKPMPEAESQEAPEPSVPDVRLEINHVPGPSMQFLVNGKPSTLTERADGSIELGDVAARDVECTPAAQWKVHDLDAAIAETREQGEPHDVDWAIAEMQKGKIVSAGEAGPFGMHQGGVFDRIPSRTKQNVESFRSVYRHALGWVSTPAIEESIGDEGPIDTTDTGADTRGLG